MSSHPRPTLGRIALAPLVLVAGLSLAAPAAAQLKIGVFDKQRVVDQSKLGRAAKERFERLQGQREQDVAEKQKAFETLKQSYEQKASVLSEEKRRELARQVERAKDELQAAAINADRDLQRAYEQALVEIVNKIEPVIAEFGRENSYDFLFDVTSVAFTRQSHDVTEDVIRKLNAVHPE